MVFRPPNDISMILSLAGEDPESVIATGGNYLHKRIADVTTTHLEFPSGLRAHIFVSWLHPFKEQKLIVVGERKMAVFDDTKRWAKKLLTYSHRIEWQNNVPVPAKAEPEGVEIHETEPLRLECVHFLNCIAESRQPITYGHEGLRVLRVLKASQRSLDDNGRRIDIRESPGPSVSTGPNPVGSGGYFLHPSAVVDEGCAIGSGTKIWHFSHILKGSKIGKNCNIGQNVVIGPHVEIGDGCKIQNNVSVYEGVTIEEEEVFCGPSMVFTNVYNPRAHIPRMEEIRPTLVKKGATFGANCTIICGVTIGRYAFIGAGAVVTKDVPDHALVVGNPAEQIGWVCECGDRLTDDLGCRSCSKRYKRSTNGLGEIS